MFRFCLKPNSGSFAKLLVICIGIQTLVIISLIYEQKIFWREPENEVFIEYRLVKGRNLVFSQRYKKYPIDLHFPALEDLVIIDSNHIGINPKNIGVQYSHSKTDLQSLINYHFQPIITKAERKLVLFTFQTFINLCRRHKLTYFITYGSLLGSYRHHGMVPWDDDIDVLMNETQKNNVVLTLGNIPGFELSHMKDYQWKFYPKFYKTLESFPHRWPFVDIFFFAENSTHIWDSTTPSDIDPGRMYTKDEVFPLVGRPFEGLLLLAPCDATSIMQRAYKNREWCLNNFYWHKLERQAPPRRPRRIRCAQLHHLYPFVFRKFTTNKSWVTEILKINGRTITTYESRNQCGTSKN